MKNAFKTTILMLILFIPTVTWAANDFSGDSRIKAVYKFEPSNLTVDSKGSNTLTPSADPPTSNTTAGYYAEGAGSADFELDSTQYYSIADALLDAGFPLKSGDTTKRISVTGWVRPEALQNYARIYQKGSIDEQESSLGLLVYSNGSFVLRYGTSAGLGTTEATVAMLSSGTLANGRLSFFAFSYRDDTQAWYCKVSHWDTDHWVEYENSGTLETTINVEAGPLYIGTRDTQNYWDGTIDELVFANDVLSEEEFDAIRAGTYSGGAGPTQLTAPTLSSPVDTAIGVSTSTSLSWSDTNTSPNETNYYIRIKAGAGSYQYYTAAADTTSVSAATAFGSALSNSTTYSWSVQAKGDGSTTSDSDWPTDRTFTTEAGASVRKRRMIGGGIF
jgi:hypothetical protein